MGASEDASCFTDSWLENYNVPDTQILLKKFVSFLHSEQEVDQYNPSYYKPLCDEVNYDSCFWYINFILILFVLVASYDTKY